MITIALLKTYSTFPTAERYPKKFSFVAQSRQYADQLILNFSQLSGSGTDGTVGTVGTSGVCDGKSKNGIFGNSFTVSVMRCGISKISQK